MTHLCLEPFSWATENLTMRILCPTIPLLAILISSPAAIAKPVAVYNGSGGPLRLVGQKSEQDMEFQVFPEVRGEDPVRTLAKGSSGCDITIPDGGLVLINQKDERKLCISPFDVMAPGGRKVLTLFYNHWTEVRLEGDAGDVADGYRLQFTGKETARIYGPGLAAAAGEVKGKAPEAAPVMADKADAKAAAPAAAPAPADQADAKTAAPAAAPAPAGQAGAKTAAPEAAPVPADKGEAKAATEAAPAQADKPVPRTAATADVAIPADKVEAKPVAAEVAPVPAAAAVAKTY